MRSAKHYTKGQEGAAASITTMTRPISMLFLALALGLGRRSVEASLLSACQGSLCGNRGVLWGCGGLPEGGYWR